MRLSVINVYLQDARWQDAAKTEACLAGIDNQHKNNNNRHKNINNRRPSQKLAKRLDPLSCDQYVRIFLDKGCDGSCRTKIANCYFNLVPFSRKTCVCCIADNLLFKVPF